MAVLKIAPIGINAETGAEKDLSMTSDRSCIVELFSGYVDITTDEFGFGSTEFTHNLGYIPAYYCFVRDPLATGNWYTHQDGYMACGTSVDTTKLYMGIYYKEASSTYKVFYSIWGNRQDDGEGSGNNNVSGNIRISKDGYDAEKETDARNMKFFSGKNTFKVDKTLSGSCSVTINDSVIFKTIPHNLGYVPVAFVLNDSSYGISGGQMLPNVGGSINMSYYVNSTNLVIVIEDLISAGSPPFNMTFKYKILRDKII